MVLHHFLLVPFAGILIEGFQLIKIANNVFDVWATKLTVFYALVAYIVPLLIVLITIITASFIEENVLMAYSAYETYSPKNFTYIFLNFLFENFTCEHYRCWLYQDWTWAFSGPAYAVILVLDL